MRSSTSASRSIEGCEINDSPLEPTCKRCRRLAAEKGDELPVAWLSRQERYREKLATPDVTVADLIGDIDPIKAANQRLTYADEEVIHYGIIPRTNRGIFAINELPDLAPRIQVALLNILEERDLQIRGFPVRIPMDVVLVFSANPEDYTSRGNIITPLKDRIDSQILTHYPQKVETARRITEQEAWLATRRQRATIEIPDYVRDLVESIAFVARESELVDQSSGVSARLTIAAIELLQSNLERRAALTGDAFRLSAPLRSLDGAAGHHRQGGDGVRGRAAGRGGRGAQADRARPRQAVRDEVPAPWSAPAWPQRAERERRGYGEIDPDDLDDVFAGRRVKKKEPPREEAQPAAPAEPAYDTILAGSPRATASPSPTSSRSPNTSASSAACPRSPTWRASTPSSPATRSWRSGWSWSLEGLHQALRLTREDLDSTITFQELMKFNVLAQEFDSDATIPRCEITTEIPERALAADRQDHPRRLVPRPGVGGARGALAVRRRQVVPRRFAAHAAPLRRRRAQRLETRSGAEVRQPRLSLWWGRT